MTFTGWEELPEGWRFCTVEGNVVLDNRPMQERSRRTGAPRWVDPQHAVVPIVAFEAVAERLGEHCG